MEDKKVFLSKEHKEELIKPNNDKMFKLQVLDNFEFIANNMPTCDKHNIKSQIKLQWFVIFFILTSLVGGSMILTRTKIEKIQENSRIGALVDAELRK